MKVLTAVGNPGLHLTGHFLKHYVKHVSELPYRELRTLRYLYTNSHPLPVQGHYEERAKVNMALLKSPTCRPSKLLCPESALWQRVVWELFTSNFQGRRRGCRCYNSILIVLLSGCFFMCEFHFTNRNVNSLNAWATAYSICIASPHKFWRSPCYWEIKSTKPTMTWAFPRLPLQTSLCSPLAQSKRSSHSIYLTCLLPV